MNEEEKKAIEIVKDIAFDRGIRQSVDGELEDLVAIEDVLGLVEKQQKEIRKLQRNIEIIINEIENKAKINEYLNKITAGINKPTEIAYITLMELLEDINKKIGE